MVMGGLMRVLLNGEQLEEVDCFKYLGSHRGSEIEGSLIEGVKGMWYTE